MFGGIELMAGDGKQDQTDRTVRTRTVRIPKAANDNWIAVSDDLPDPLPIEEWELELLEADLSDIIAGMIPANDN